MESLPLVRNDIQNICMTINTDGYHGEMKFWRKFLYIISLLKVILQKTKFNRENLHSNLRWLSRYENQLILKSKNLDLDSGQRSINTSQSLDVEYLVVNLFIVSCHIFSLNWALGDVAISMNYTNKNWHFFLLLPPPPKQKRLYMLAITKPPAAASPNLNYWLSHWADDPCSRIK